jgi:hypothetical protein
LLTHRLSCKVPQDIPSASLVRDIPPERESPKVDKPPSPPAGKTPLKMPNPPSAEGTRVPTGGTSNPIFPPVGDSQRDATHQSPRPDPAKHQDASPTSPKSFGLGVHGGQQSGEGPSTPKSGKQP